MVKINKGRMIFSAITVLLILLTASLIIFRPKRTAPPALEEEKIAVTVMRVEPQSIEDMIELPGKIKPVKDIIVAAEQSGYVQETIREEGDVVRQGDTLMRIDDRLWHTNVRRAELAARNARRDFGRLRDLHGAGAVSRSEFDAVETRTEAAEIALEEAKIQLEKCAPAAPINGLVEERLVSAGEFVQHGRPIFRLIDASSVKVVFDIPERDVSYLKTGKNYNFVIDAVPDRVFTGQVTFVATHANPANNAFRAELQTDNKEGLMRGGMIARIKFVRGFIKDAVILPLNAVVPMRGETVAFVVEEEQAIRRTVRIGAILDSQAVIRSGIKVGDSVIIDGNRAVLDGTPVRVVEDWAPEPAVH